MKYLRAAVAVILVVLLYFLLQGFVSLAFGLYMGITPPADGLFEEHFAGFLIHISITANLLMLFSIWLFFLVRRALHGKGESFSAFCGFAGIPAATLAAATAAGVALYMLNTAVFHFTGIPDLFPEHIEMLERIFELNVFLVFLGVGVTAPFVEEVVYRGVVFNRLRGVMPASAALFLQAVIFGLMHMNILQAGYASVLGAVFALAYLMTGSIWVPIAMHFSFNTASILMSRMPGPSDPETAAAVLLICGAGGILACARFFMRNYPLRRSPGSHSSGAHGEGAREDP